MDKPQPYIRQPSKVQVMRFKGHYDSALSITHWVTDMNEMTRYLPGPPERLVIITDNGLQELKKGDYLVHDEEFGFRAYTPEKFNERIRREQP